jgi:cellobiose phosphorylase
MRTCGVVPWASGDVATFVVRHYLGVRFEAGQLVIRPALYPDSPPLSANLRFRRGRLRLHIDGSGPIREASLDGEPLQPSPDGSLRLPRRFDGGTVVIHLTPGRR